jgi:PAS domain S-box-containing protein
VSLLAILFIFPGLGPSHAESVIRVGVYDFAPLVFVNEEGKPAGLFVDVLEYVAKQEGWRIEYVPGTWDQCLKRIEQGEIDLITCIGYSKQRSERIDFTKDFLFVDSGRVYQRAGGDIDSIFDLEGKRVAVLKGSIYTSGLKEYLKSFEVRAELVEKDEYRQVFRAIEDGEVVAGTHGRVAGTLLESEYKIKPTEILFTPVKLGFATPKGKGAEILKALDSQIAQLKADKNSLYYQRLRHWTEFYAQRTKTSPWLLRGLGSAVVLCLVALVFVYALKRQVRVRTSQLTLANVALRESEEKLKLITETVEDVFWMTTPNIGEMVYVSPSYKKIWGCSKESLYQSPKSFMESVHPEDREELLKVIEEHENRPWNCEYRIVRPDGTIRWIHDRGYPILDEDGNLRLRTGVSTDITNRKQAEETLRQSEEKFAKTFLSAPLLMTLSKVDDGTYVEVNDTFCAVSGFSREEAIGNTSTGLGWLSQADRARLIEELQASGRVREIELELYTKDKRRVHCIYNGELVTVGDRQFILSLAHDITDRKKAEESRRESEQEFRWLLQSMTNAFVLFESVLDENGMFVSYRFVYINEAYERITGVRNEEVRGKTVHEVWPSTENSWIMNYGEVAVTGCSKEFEMYHDATKKLYHCNVYRPWDSSDRFCVVFEDITERKKTEEALRDSEEKYRTLFEESFDGLFITSPGGKILDMNKKGVAMFGYDTKEEILRLDLERDVYAHLPDRERILSLVNAQGSAEYEVVVKKKSGEEMMTHWVPRFLVRNDCCKNE